MIENLPAFAQVLRQRGQVALAVLPGAIRYVRAELGTAIEELKAQLDEVKEELKLEAFDDYWNKETRPKVKNLTIKIIPEDLTRVFDRHVTSDRARSGRQGTGLGLAIVAELTAAMGGTVHAESPIGPDHVPGCRVQVRLPGPAPAGPTGPTGPHEGAPSGT